MNCPRVRILALEEFKWRDLIKDLNVHFVLNSIIMSYYHFLVWLTSMRLLALWRKNICSDQVEVEVNSVVSWMLIITQTSGKFSSCIPIILTIKLFYKQ